MTIQSAGDDSIYNLPSAAFGGGGSILQVNQITSGAQTPPITLVMDDGRVFHAWADASGVLQGRLFEAGSAPATDQFSLSSQ